MHRILNIAVGSIALAAVAFGAPAPASATSSGSKSVTQTVEGLRAHGYSVQLNGTRDGPLTKCSLQAVRGPFSSTPGAAVYVDLSCSTGY